MKRPFKYRLKFRSKPPLRKIKKIPLKKLRVLRLKSKLQLRIKLNRSKKRSPKSPRVKTTFKFSKSLQQRKSLSHRSLNLNRSHQLNLMRMNWRFKPLRRQ